MSGHSLRVGSAQSLAAAGASVVEMQQAGRWKSPSMPGQYARKQMGAARWPDCGTRREASPPVGVALTESRSAEIASRYTGLTTLSLTPST